MKFQIVPNVLQNISSTFKLIDLILLTFWFELSLKKKLSVHIEMPLLIVADFSKTISLLKVFILNFTALQYLFFYRLVTFLIN